ncbi:5818_t:CDS:1, partial [Acaulospora colombiana]
FDGTTLFNQKNPIRIGYGSIFTMRFKLPAGVKPEIRASLINLGFQTHSAHMSQRYVELKVLQVITVGNGIFLANIQSPPRANVMPPGRVYVFLMHRGTPANTACEVLIG